MSAPARSRFGPAAVALALLWLSTAVGAQQPNLGSDAEREAGKKLYDKYCGQCHGVEGDGKGVAEPYLKPKPRDFTSGKYKIRTTPSGSLPTDADLKNIIRRGMPYSSMPAWPQFSDQQLQRLAYYLKTFSADFQNPEYLAEGMTVPKAPAMTEETIRKGREVYEQLGCIRCHGELGRGDGMSAPTLVDDWGDHIRAADLTAKWTFRGGATRRDLFRTLTTGINGTPMPSYADALSDEQRWHLVDYVASLSDGEEAPYASLVTVAAVDGALDLDDAESREALLRGEGAFEGAPEAMFPLVGQIVQPGRSFHPLVTDIRVQAVYSPTEIALRVTWNDLIADTSGTNDPALPVPVFDPAAAAAAAPAFGTGEEDDPWADDPWAAEETAAEDEGWDEGWEDEGAGEASIVAPVSQWSDAVAIQLPMELPAGIQKPYWIFGDPGKAVDLWFLDLAGAQPRRFVGRGSQSVVPAEYSDVTAAANYDRGEWAVIFKRPLRSAEGMIFEQDQFVPIAFSVWDGFNQERGNRRALTQWFYLYLQPREQQSAVGPMAKAAFGVLIVELLLIALIRWRHRRERTKRGHSAFSPQMG